MNFFLYRPEMSEGLNNVKCIGMSSDGKYQTVLINDTENKKDSIMYSSDKGISWKTSGYLGGFKLELIRDIDSSKCGPEDRVSDATYCNYILISADGKTQLIILSKYIVHALPMCLISSYVLQSSNYGESWSLANSLPVNLAYSTSCMSSSGKYQTICTNYKIFFSNYLVAYTNNTLLNGIYYSSDYGNTWTQSSAISTVNYISVCTTDDGSLQKCIASDGYIYSSVDYGKTWTRNNLSFKSSIKITNQLLLSIYNMGISGQTGQYQVILERGRYIYVSTDYGATWYIRLQTVQLLREDFISDIFVSNSGQYMCVQSYGILYTSTDYGVNWTSQVVLQYSETDFGYTNLESSLYYQKLYTGSPTIFTKFLISKDITYCLFSSALGNYIFHNNIGQIPSEAQYSGINPENITLIYSKISNSLQNSTDLVMSEDGLTQLLLSPLSISKISGSVVDNYSFKINSGMSGATGFFSLNSISSNSNLSLFVGCGQVINTDRSVVNMILSSTDSVTWSPISQDSNTYSKIVTDSNGKIWTAISGDNILLGVNGFGSFTKAKMSDLGVYYRDMKSMQPEDVSVSPEFFTDICISSDGTKQAAITNYGTLFVSSSPGTWSVNQFTLFYSLNKNLIFPNNILFPENNKIATSDSGKYISVSQEGFGVFVSSDSGNTFNIGTLLPVGSWKDIVMSSSGKYQMVISTNVGVYISVNFGQSWSGTNLPNEMYSSCKLSSSGKFYTIVSDKNIYKGNLF